MARLAAVAGVMAAIAGAGPLAAAEGRTVAFVATNWAPYYHSDLPEQGIVTALSRAAFERTPYSFTIDFKPFARAMGETKAGHYDGLMGAWYNAERDQVFDFSAPVVDTRNVLVAWSEAVDWQSYDSLRDLVGYSIGIGRGWAYDPEFDQASFLAKEVAPDHLTNLRKLFNGRLDMMAVEERVFFHALDQRPTFSPDKIHILSPPLSETPIYNIVREAVADSEAVLSAFNQGLAEIRENGKAREIANRLDWRQ